MNTKILERLVNTSSLNNVNNLSAELNLQNRGFYNEETIEICTVGERNPKIFNIFTAAAIVTSAIGINVIKQETKHGNKNFINALGINLCSSYDEAKEQFEKDNICFIDSESYDFIQPERLMLGTSSPQFAENLINVLKKLELKHVMVVNAQVPPLNVISICSETTIYELKNNEILKYMIKPEDFGIKKASISSLTGATPEYNAGLIFDIFSGKIKDAKLDAVALNAGAMIYLSGKAKNLLDGILKAYSVINSKNALNKILALQTSYKPVVSI